MNRSTNSALLVAAVLLLMGIGGGALWLTLGPGEGTTVEGVGLETPLVPGVEQTDPIEPVANLVEREHTGEGGADPLDTTVVFPLVVELTQIQSGIYPEEEGVLPIGSGANAKLVGTLRDDKGRPAAGGAVVFEGGPNEGRTLYCDATGSFGASDLYQGISIVRVEIGGSVSRREVLLRQLAETPLHVSLARPAKVNGTVKDRMGNPIEGAIVELDGGEAVTDAEGVFYFPRVTPGKVLAIVEKDGYALFRQTLHVTAGHLIPADKITFTLEVEAQLEVHVAEAMGSREPSKLYLFPAGGQRVNSSVGQRTFPWHEINPVEIQPGGTVLIEKLPPGHVTLMLFHSGAKATPPTTNLRLYEGKKSAQILHLTNAPSLIKGQVVGPDGKPLAGVNLRLEAPHRDNATTRAMGKKPTFALGMVLPHVPSAVQEVRSDDRGRFLFTAFPEITNGYYLSGVSRDGELRGYRVVSPGAMDVRLALRKVEAGTASLTVGMKGRYQGLPVEVKVQGAPRDPVVLAPDKELVIEDLEPGTWRVTAHWNDESVLQGKQVELGDETMFIVLPRGALHGQTEEERRRAGK